MLTKLLKGHTSSVYSVAVSPDGSKIVSGSDDNTIIVRWRCFGCILGQNASWFVHDPQVWDFASGEVLKKIDCKSKALSVQFSPDGSKLAIGLGSGENKGQVWVSCFVFCSLDDHIERDLCTF